MIYREVQSITGNVDQPSKTETLHQIAEIGHVTNEYLLYGDQENQYILEMLQKGR